jgi:2-polyprenyl-6-methoxyphenol hydroxylase-like FAD-dependent oxidoreductase
MTSIGIVGAGVAGLHLGLFLRAHDIPVTIYTDKTGDELAGGRLLNSVGHHHPTLERERQLGVHHWDADEYGFTCHHHYLGGPMPLAFRGDFTRPSSAIDYRLYLPRLMGDFEDRGGRLAVQAVQADDLDGLAGQHDLLVVASGRGTLGGLFGRRADKSPYDKPQRRLCVALWHGVARSEPKGVTLGISPGHGELIEIPIYSFDGHVTALLFENIPGGDLEPLADLRYDEDPKAFEATTLQKLKEHYPATFERVDPATFAVTRPQDILQGALIPHMRADYAQLANGKYALAVGDVHAVVDPLVGQGANSASYSAWTVGEAILEDLGFDELFCQRVARRRADMVEGISDWTNFMLAPPAPQLVAMLVAMAQRKDVCDEFTDNFGDGARQWSTLATPERTRAHLARHGVDMDALLASLPG